MTPFGKSSSLTPREENDSLQSEYGKIRTGYDAATAQSQGLQQQRKLLRRTPGTTASPIIAGKESFRPTTLSYSSTAPGVEAGLGTLDSRIQAAEAQRQSYTPQFKSITGKLRNFTQLTQENAALRSVGAAANTRPAVAARPPNFSNVRATVTQGPAGPGAVAGATSPAGGATSNPNAVIGTFQGRSITRGQSDQIAGRLPTANSMPVTGPNGSYAASTGTGAPAPAAAASPVRFAARPAPYVAAPTADAYNTREANAQRAKVLSDIDSQLFALRGRTNTRSSRELVGDLVRTQAGLVNAGADTATGVASGDRDSRLAAQQTNAQTFAQQQNDLTTRDVAELNSQTQLQAARFARRPETNANNEMGFISDTGVFQPVVDAQGRTQRAQQTQNTGLAGSDILKAYSDQYTAISNSLTTPEEKTAALQQLESSPIGQRYVQVLGGGGGAAAEQPPAAGAMRGADGKWYLKGANGKFNVYEEPK